MKVEKNDFDKSPCFRCGHWFIGSCLKGHYTHKTLRRVGFYKFKRIYPKECKDFELSWECQINPVGVNKKHFQGFIGKVKKYFKESVIK